MEVFIHMSHVCTHAHEDACACTDPHTCTYRYTYAYIRACMHPNNQAHVRNVSLCLSLQRDDAVFC